MLYRIPPTATYESRQETSRTLHISLVYVDDGFDGFGYSESTSC